MLIIEAVVLRFVQRAEVFCIIKDAELFGHRKDKVLELCRLVSLNTFEPTILFV